MKPITKIQKEVERLRVTLPDINDRQKRYAYQHCFKHSGWMRKDGRIVCTECGHSWDSDHALADTICGAVCPHCGTRLDVIKSRKIKDMQDDKTFLIMTTCGGFQVLRFFIVKRAARAGYECYYSMFEAVQHWIDARGKVVVVSRPLNYTYYHYSISSSRPMEIRDVKGRENMYNIGAKAVYSHRSYIPELRRNGFDGRLHGCYPLDLCTALLSDSMAETLMKSKQYRLLEWYLASRDHYLKPYWPAVRICIRNVYEIRRPQEWIDMVQAMIDLGRDIHNPHYVCPADLDAMHDKFIQLRRDAREREERDKRRRMFAEMDAEYRKKKGRFLGLSITDGEIELKPLQSVAEFEQEGAAMHHCVFDMNYYKKDNSLILSARVAGKRVETVELSLKSLKVLQSRGACNKNTEYHKRIIDLVHRNAGQIRKLMPRNNNNKRTSK